MPWQSHQAHGCGCDGWFQLFASAVLWFEFVSESHSWLVTVRRTLCCAQVVCAGASPYDSKQNRIVTHTQ